MKSPKILFALCTPLRQIPPIIFWHKYELVLSSGLVKIFLHLVTFREDDNMARL
jgi:hypothetical protein